MSVFCRARKLFYTCVLIITPQLSRGYQRPVAGIPVIRWPSLGPSRAVLSKSYHCSSAGILSARRLSDDVIPEVDSAQEDAPQYKRGQTIKVEVTRFGPLGASVSIDDGNAIGLVMQEKIAMFRDGRDGKDVVAGEVLEGYVERVREDGRIDVSLRPLGVSRINNVKQVILDAIEGSPSGSIPVGDKSSADDIYSYFHGISKTDFKNAVGALYRDGLVKPGAMETSLTTEEERDAAKKLLAAKESVSGSKRAKGDQQDSKWNDDSSRKIFVGNLPNKAKKEAVLKEISKVIDPVSIVAFRLSVDGDQKSRGFGYLELTDESLVEPAMDILTGFEVGGRKVRVDYADPNKKNGGSKEGSGVESTSKSVRTRLLSRSTGRKAAVSGGSGDDDDDNDDGAEEQMDPKGRRDPAPRVSARPNRDTSAIAGGAVGGGQWAQGYKRSTDAASASASASSLRERQRSPSRQSRSGDDYLEDDFEGFDIDEDYGKSFEDYGVGSENSGRGPSGVRGSGRERSPATATDRDDSKQGMKSWVKDAIRSPLMRSGNGGRERNRYDDSGYGDRNRGGDRGGERERGSGPMRGGDRERERERGPMRGGDRGSDRDSDGRRIEATLFVGNLSYKVDENILAKEIEKIVGRDKVASIRFPTDQNTGKKRGFAYVDMYEEDAAKKVFYDMHDKEILGRSVNIDDATRR